MTTGRLSPRGNETRPKHTLCKQHFTFKKHSSHNDFFYLYSKHSKHCWIRSCAFVLTKTLFLIVKNFVINHHTAEWDLLQSIQTIRMINPTRSTISPPDKKFNKNKYFFFIYLFTPSQMKYIFYQFTPDTLHYINFSDKAIITVKFHSLLIKWRWIILHKYDKYMMAHLCKLW